MPITVILAAMSVGLALPLLWWSVVSGRRPKEAIAENLRRGLVGQTDYRSIVLSTSAGSRAVRPMLRALAQTARRITPMGLLDALDKQITLAGRPARWPLERVLAAKLMLAVGSLLVGLVTISSRPGMLTVVYAIALTAVGFFFPDAVLARQASLRQKTIRRELADTIDQITVCVEAGLGFESAMARSARAGTGPLAEEFRRTLQEMQIGATRGQALRQILERTQVEELRHMVLALLQAESYGLPIAEVLRVQAAELRIKRRQAAEEHAMKIPVKIVFPLVFCILPTLMIAILGPAGIRAAKFFSGATMP
ncbi:MAG TPA: type II secretion system F family protein [Egibacteraceae bacterium]|nr:type II secretion system F family protein [Egibacteraceae bacterium]